MNTLVAFKQKLREGRPVYGPFMKAVDAAFAEASGCAGFDFVILDMEHGPAGFADLQNLIRGAEAGGAAPIVRASDSSETAISRALDLGAAGVQVPQIGSAAEACAAVRAAKYYPKGARGVCRVVRAARSSAMPREAYFARANESLVILQVEGREALAGLDGILAVEGVDILFIGPYDLSQSFGVPGQVSHPSVVAAVTDISARAKKAGVATGVFCDTPEAVARWRGAGIQYLSYSVDVGLYTDACAAILRQLCASQ
jgi:4-hydroxy-2-oxoheptanedioate aldolase